MNMLNVYLERKCARKGRVLLSPMIAIYLRRQKRTRIISLSTVNSYYVKFI